MAEENEPVVPERAMQLARELLEKARLNEANGDRLEAEACTHRAMQIIAKYGITEAMLDDGQLNSKEVSELWIDLNAPYVPEQFALLNRIALCLGGHAIIIANDAKLGRWMPKEQRHKTISLWSKGARVHVFGFPGDLERIEFLFTYLLAQATAGMVKAKEPAGKRRSDYLSAWLQAFSQAIYGRLWEIRQRAQRDTDQAGTGRGTELVLADRKSRVDAAFAALYPQTEAIALYQGSVGRSDGYKAGLDADLDQTKIRDGQRALPAGRS